MTISLILITIANDATFHEWSICVIHLPDLDFVKKNEQIQNFQLTCKVLKVRNDFFEKESKVSKQLYQVFQYFLALSLTLELSKHHYFISSKRCMKIEEIKFCVNSKYSFLFLFTNSVKHLPSWTKYLGQTLVFM